MRKCFLVGLMIWSASTAHAQFINQIFTDPIQPTDATPVRVIADLMFSSASCDDKTLNWSQTFPGRFDAFSMHCTGVLTVICYDKDTFDLGLLPAGNYRFVLQVDAGFGQTPCTPGINPGPVDSIDFTVTAASGLGEIVSNDFFVYPNPSTGDFNVKWNVPFSEGYWMLYDLSGKFLRKQQVGTESASLDLTDLTAGFYWLQFATGDKISAPGRICIIE
ncbi:MAG: T9SS type A sorting domain-containing protein [Bacteroidia bacterium]|nr:T9SS type A sorting domain-containing protein [Bacteroidia bacterium]